MSEIAQNLSAVQQAVRDTALACGRDPEKIKLIAVSKTKPVEMIREAIDCGTVDFGENYPQELAEKARELSGVPIRWHMIGHLQRNKVRMILPYLSMIHAVDSLRLAEQIEAEAARIGKKIPILLEVNIAREESKFGLKAEEVLPLVRTAAAMPHIRIKGLMTIAPFVEDAEQNRIHFRNLHQLSVDIARQNIDNVDMSELSMGMTGDYKVAIEEGATMIRVGTAIFGAREYHQ